MINSVFFVFYVVSSRVLFEYFLFLLFLFFPFYFDSKPKKMEVLTFEVESFVSESQSSSSSSKRETCHKIRCKSGSLLLVINDTHVTGAPLDFLVQGPNLDENSPFSPLIFTHPPPFHEGSQIQLIWRSSQVDLWIGTVTWQQWNTVCLDHDRRIFFPSHRLSKSPFTQLLSLGSPPEIELLINSTSIKSNSSSSSSSSKSPLYRTTLQGVRFISPSTTTAKFSFFNSLDTPIRLNLTVLRHSLLKAFLHPQHLWEPPVHLKHFQPSVSPQSCLSLEFRFTDHFLGHLSFSSTYLPLRKSKRKNNLPQTVFSPFFCVSPLFPHRRSKNPPSST